MEGVTFKLISENQGVTYSKRLGVAVCFSGPSMASECGKKNSGASKDCS